MTCNNGHLIVERVIPTGVGDEAAKSKECLRCGAKIDDDQQLWPNWYPDGYFDNDNKRNMEEYMREIRQDPPPSKNADSVAEEIP
jgi:hypothetical protein